MAKAQQVSRTISKAKDVSVSLTKDGRCTVNVESRTVLVVRKVTGTLHAYFHPAPTADGQN